MSVIYILWLRELRRYSRSRAQVIASLGQPLLYLLVLGFGLGPVFQKAGQGSYLQFVAPGVVAMAVLFSSVFSGMGLLWDRQFGFLKETLVAPVPRIQIMLGRTLGGATVAVIQGLLVMAVCFIAGFRMTDVTALPLALFFMAMIACTFSAMGTAIGSALENMQGFQLIMNFLVMPIFFLSGALYPLTNLPKALGYVVSLDPLAYGVDGLRSTLIGVSHFGVAIDALVLVISACILLVIGSRLFLASRSEMPRARSAVAHQRVIAAGLELVAARGLDGTSMDAIAETSGVSKVTDLQDSAQDASCRRL